MKKSPEARKMMYRQKWDMVHQNKKYSKKTEQKEKLSIREAVRNYKEEL